MTYDEYINASHSASKLLDDGDRDGAIAAFKALAESDLPGMDRSVMCLNVGIMYGQKNDVATALEWYDKGVALEAVHGRFAMNEMKATYLAQVGKKQESLTLYKQLLLRRDLNMNDRERIIKNVKTLEDSF